MDFGIHIGTRGCLASREDDHGGGAARGGAGLRVSRRGRPSDRAGADRRALSLHGGWHLAGAPTGECFDCIATLAFLAGCTQRIKLLTSVVVVPYRPAVLAAKLFLTADVLSGGRVIAGVGTGWMREEFEALGTPPFAERGAVTDEYLQAWRRCGPSNGRRSTANTRNSTMWCSRRSRHRSRICRSGSAAKVPPRCDAP